MVDFFRGYLNSTKFIKKRQERYKSSSLFDFNKGDLFTLFSDNFLEDPAGGANDPLTDASPGITFESNNTANEGIGTYGSAAISTTQKYAGTYALRCSSGAGGNALHGIGQGTSGSQTAFNEATIYTSFRFYIATAPNVTQGSTAIALGEEITSGNIKWELHLNSDRKLVFKDKNLATVSTGTTILSTATWYEIQIKSGTGASAAFEVKIGSTSEISGTANQLTGNHDAVFFGFYTSITNGTPDYYYDNIVIDRGDYPNQDGGGASVAINGALGGVSALSGSILNTRGVTSQVDAVSTANALLAVLKTLNSQVDALSTIDGVLLLYKYLTAQIDAVSTASGDLKNSIGLLGALDATTSLNGILNASKSLIGQSDSVSSLLSETAIARSLASNVISISTLDGSIALIKFLVSQVDAVSTASGELTKLSSLSAQIDALSSTLGSLNVLKSLISQVDSISDLTASLIVAKSLISQIDAVSSLSAELTKTLSLTSELNALSSISGDLNALKSLVSTLDAQSLINGNLSTSQEISIDGTISGVSELTSLSSISRSLSSAIDGALSAEGQINIIRGLSGSIFGESTISGNTELSIALSVLLDAVTVITGQLHLDLGVTAPIQIIRALRRDFIAESIRKIRLRSSLKVYSFDSNKKTSFKSRKRDFLI